MLSMSYLQNIQNERIRSANKNGYKFRTRYCDPFGKAPLQQQARGVREKRFSISLRRMAGRRRTIGRHVRIPRRLMEV